MEPKYMRKLFICFFMIVILFASCKKFLEVKSPTDQVSSQEVFNSDATAISAITGIYSEMMSGVQFINSGVTFYAGMCADELYYYQPGSIDEFVKNNITAGNHTTLSNTFWTPAYRYIYVANLCLEKLNSSTALTPGVKNRLTGECKFIRAFCYFHLAGLFGDVPLSLTSDYRVNEKLPRSAVQQIYAQIERDLKDAGKLLTEEYSLTERTVPNLWAAKALLARVYLYMENWTKAEQEATVVINAGTYSLGTDPEDVFLKTSNETIWQLAPVAPSRNTWEGFMILPSSNNTLPTYLLTTELVNSFEPGDIRKSAWINSRVFSGQTLYYPYKYKIRTATAINEYYVVLRLAELYLIRAEARGQLNNIPTAIADLNQIRTRAGLAPLLSSIDQTHCLLAVEKERRSELFAEWGNRWYDLKRTGRADIILKSLKPSTWQQTDVLWPIPIDQIKLNAALTQNAGY